MRHIYIGTIASCIATGSRLSSSDSGLRIPEAEPSQDAGGPTNNPAQHQQPDVSLSALATTRVFQLPHTKSNERKTHNHKVKDTCTRTTTSLLECALMWLSRLSYVVTAICNCIYIEHRHESITVIRLLSCYSTVLYWSSKCPCTSAHCSVSHGISSDVFAAEHASSAPLPY